jgi:hypothetical protein
MSYARQFSPQNREAFLLALHRIEGVSREPTPWEAACLFSALGAMASGNEQLADQKIALCGNAEAAQHHAWNVPAALTVAGLQRTLAALSDLEQATVKGDSRAAMELPREVVTTLLRYTHRPTRA